MTKPSYRFDLERTLSQDGVQVSLSHIGEGCDGDFMPDDPDDVPLLRMDVSIWEEGEWQALDNGSYCTDLSCAASDAELDEALAIMHEQITAAIKEGRQKRTCEWLSWMGEPNMSRFRLPAVAPS
jgi:hypothetical protein